MIEKSEVQRRHDLWIQGYWEIPNGLDTSTFDFNWRPEPYDRPYVHQFGTQHQKTGGPRFVVPESEGIKYQSFQKTIKLPDLNNWEIPIDINVDKFDFSWHPDGTEPPMIYEFGTQWQKTGGPKYIVHGANYTRYIDTQIAIKIAGSDNRCWRPLVANCTIDFSWHPNATDPPFIYIFGNQWYDAHTMPTYQYRVKGATQKKYITDINATLLPNKDNWEIPDYITDFDYSWVPNPHEPPYIHQFRTEWGIDAGPKYIVNGATIIKQNPLLIANSNTNNITDTIIYTDSIFDAFVEHKFKKPFVHIKKEDSKIDPYTILRTDNKLIHVIDGIEAIISDKVPLTRFFDKITDYQDIKNHFLNIKSELLDIIFFSNGEACAEDNYCHLLSLNLPNRISRIDGVKGRVASQHAAANASNTPWYFLVNAKLKVNTEFDFGWRPNVLKSRRHYIFTATNPVNNLEYGHQAIVANNKKLTLTTIVKGLDFTMDSPTEVVNINSGIATYNTSIWDTWRTSFRECIKLLSATDDESKVRLNSWLTLGNGKYGEYSIKGANDAVEYYKEVNGELEKLMSSYDWQWLYARFNHQYK